MSPSGLYAYSKVDPNRTYAQNLEQGLEMYEYVPKLVAELEPGDVYFNPSWWWHWVENTTDWTIGVSTRFAPAGLWAGNPTYSALGLFTPFQYKALRKIARGQTLGDEDLFNRTFFQKPTRRG